MLSLTQVVEVAYWVCLYSPFFMSCFSHGYFFFFVIIVLFNKEALCFSAFRYGKLSNLVVASRSNAL